MHLFLSRCAVTKCGGLGHIEGSDCWARDMKDATSSSRESKSMELPKGNGLGCFVSMFFILTSGDRAPPVAGC